MTISVRDSAALLDATSGPDVGDPATTQRTITPSCSRSAAPRPLRIGFTLNAPTGVPVHADCVEAVRDAADLGETNSAITLRSLNRRSMARRRAPS